MGKKFLTAREIDEHADCGVKELEIDDTIVVTDIGQERARERGVRLVRVQKASIPADHSTTRPQLSQDVKMQVRSAVIARLGAAPENLDAVINKVIGELK